MTAEVSADQPFAHTQGKPGCDGDYKEDLPSTRVPPVELTGFVEYDPYPRWRNRVQAVYSGSRDPDSTQFGGSDVDDYVVVVFRPEIDRLLYADLLSVPSRDEPLRLDDAFAAVRAEFPDEPIQFARLPRRPGDTYEVWIGPDHERRVYVDPYEAVVLGYRGDRDDLLGVALGLHETFLAGEAGGTGNGLVGFGLLFLTVSGLILWWPRGRWREAFRVRRHATRLKVNYDLHRLAGLASLLLLFSAAITGIALVFHRVAAFLLIAALGGPALTGLPKLAEPVTAAGLPAAVLLDHARAEMPGAEATWVMPARSPTAPFLVRFRFPENPHPNGTTFVALRPDDGTPLAVHSYRAAGAGQVVADFRYPLHIGAALGFTGRLLVFVAGLSPSFLFVTGLVFWLSRRRVRRTVPGRSPARA